MASQGPNSSGTAANDASAGFSIWTNPTNVYTSNNVKATNLIYDFNSTHYLKATNFGFSIPSGATIDGIIVEVEVAEPGGLGSISTTEIKLVKGGTISGTSRHGDSSSFWPNSDTYLTYGSSTQLWGLTWTDSDINASNFGVAIRAFNSSLKFQTTIAIDHIRITVYYTASGGGPTSASALLLAGD